MSYQPPVIGSKQLLNFTASSWPAIGAYLAAAAFALALAALLMDRRRQAGSHTRRGSSNAAVHQPATDRLSLVTERM
jgi:hypothetical protein